MLLYFTGQLVPEKDASTPSPVITLIGAEGLQIGVGSEEIIEHDLIPTNTQDNGNIDEEETSTGSSIEKSSEEYIQVPTSTNIPVPETQKPNLKHTKRDQEATLNKIETSTHKIEIDSTPLLEPSKVNNSEEKSDSGEFIPEENPYYPPLPDIITPEDEHKEIATESVEIFENTTHLNHEKPIESKKGLEKSLRTKEKDLENKENTKTESPAVIDEKSIKKQTTETPIEKMLGDSPHSDSEESSEEEKNTSKSNENSESESKEHHQKSEEMLADHPKDHSDEENLTVKPLQKKQKSEENSSSEEISKEAHNNTTDHEVKDKSESEEHVKKEEKKHEEKMLGDSPQSDESEPESSSEEESVEHSTKPNIKLQHPEKHSESDESHSKEDSKEHPTTTKPEDKKHTEPMLGDAPNSDSDSVESSSKEDVLDAQKHVPVTSTSKETSIADKKEIQLKDPEISSEESDSEEAQKDQPHEDDLKEIETKILPEILSAISNKTVPTSTEKSIEWLKNDEAESKQSKMINNNATLPDSLLKKEAPGDILHTKGEEDKEEHTEVKSKEEKVGATSQVHDIKEEVAKILSKVLKEGEEESESDETTAKIEVTTQGIKISKRAETDNKKEELTTKQPNQELTTKKENQEHEKSSESEELSSESHEHKKINIFKDDKIIDYLEDGQISKESDEKSVEKHDKTEHENTEDTTEQKHEENQKEEKKTQKETDDKKKQKDVKIIHNKTPKISGIVAVETVTKTPVEVDKSKETLELSSQESSIETTTSKNQPTNLMTDDTSIEVGKDSMDTAELVETVPGFEITTTKLLAEESTEENLKKKEVEEVEKEIPIKTKRNQVG